jgi:hypothetical protein
MYDQVYHVLALLVLLWVQEKGQENGRTAAAAAAAATGGAGVLSD